MSSYDDFDDEDEYDVNVCCLSDIGGLQRACETTSVKLSMETNKFLVYETLQNLGPAASKKLFNKRKTSWRCREQFVNTQTQGSWVKVLVNKSKLRFHQEGQRLIAYSAI